MKQLRCFTCNFRKVLFFEMVFSLEIYTAEAQPVWLFVWVSWQGRLPGSLWRFFLTVFLGTFYFPVFSIPRFIVERGFTPAQFQITPSYAYELHVFFLCIPTFLLQDSNTDWDEIIKNGSISGETSSNLELSLWKKNRFQYGFNCFFPHCQGSIDWGLRFEDWIEMNRRLRRPDWGLRVCQLRLEEPGGAGLFVVCSTRSFNSFFCPAIKNKKRRKKEPVFGVVSLFI